MLQVQVASILFNDNAGNPDALGSMWYVDVLTGWDSPPQRVSAAPLPAAHGEVTVENLYNARSLSLGGICKALSNDLMYQSKYKLTSETNATANKINFQVWEDVRRYCAVFRSGEVRMTPAGLSAFRFEMTFRADDPMKYSWAEHDTNIAAGGSAVINNAGSARSYPYIDLNTSGTKPKITARPGGPREQVWEAIGAMPSDTVINMKAMTAKSPSQGSQFADVEPYSEWIFLEPGNNTIQASAGTGFHVRWRDAWI